ncbi:MAG: hypothetical protein AAFY29_20040 [Pseudomonadota bacterium]
MRTRLFPRLGVASEDGGHSSISDVFVHAGHPKTGSSAIQSALANSTDELLALGIRYPINSSEQDRVKAGAMSTGNWRSDVRKLSGSGRIEKLLGGSSAVLISGETLFNLGELRELSASIERLNRADARPHVRVLCYVRDPFEHAASQYQQTIKTWGQASAFDDYLATYQFPKRVRKFLESTSERGYEVSVLNYSRQRKVLLHTFESWLGVPDGTLQPPENKVVNRSLTRSELELQRLCNVHADGDWAQLLTDKLIHTLPDQRPEVPVASREAVAAFVARMRAETEQTNALLPVSEQYRVESEDEILQRIGSQGEDSAQFSFSADQLATLVEWIAETQNRHSRWTLSLPFWKRRKASR